MIYIKRLFSLIIGIPLFMIFVFIAMLEIACLPIKLLISYIIHGNKTKYYNWFYWLVIPIIKLLQKIDLLDKNVELE